MKRDTTSQRKRSQTKLIYDNLENRQLLATFFVGTAGNDQAKISYVDATHVNISINDTIQEKVDITDGIRLDLKNSNIGETERDEVLVDHRITGNLQIFDAEVITVDGGDNQWQLGFVANPLLNGETARDQYYIVHGRTLGRLNANITFFGFKEIHAAAGNDTFNVNRDLQYQLEIFAGAGNDLFRFASPNRQLLFQELGEPSREGSGVSVDGEAGNDRFVFRHVAEARTSGGTGFDIVDYSRADRGYTVDVGSLVEGHWLEGSERLIGAFGKPNRLEALSNDSSKLNWIVNGARSLLIDAETGKKIEMLNFNLFTGSRNAIDNFWVLRTAADLNIKDSDWVRVSSEAAANQGNLSTIEHDISFSQSSPGFTGAEPDGIDNPNIILDDSTGAGSLGVISAEPFNFSDGYISGLTGGRIYLHDDVVFGMRRDILPPAFNFYQPKIIIHGSMTAADYFVVKGTFTPTTIFSHGGDDVFQLGSTNSSRDGELGKLAKNLTINAGDGNDGLFVNDQGKASDGLPNGLGHDTTYKISDSAISMQTVWNTTATYSGIPVTRVRFSSQIAFDRELEVVRVNGSAYNRMTFEVTPSTSTKIVVQGKTATPNTADDLQIIGPLTGTVHKNQADPADGSITFGDQAQPVYFYDLPSVDAAFAAL